MVYFARACLWFMYWIFAYTAIKRAIELNNLVVWILAVFGVVSGFVLAVVAIGAYLKE